MNEAESLRALNRASELGVNFFDTANVYGTSHSEEILAKVVRTKLEQIIISAKHGFDIAEENDSDVASLRRLETEYVDVSLVHVWGLRIERALTAREILEELVKEGKIHTYGWSTGREDAVEDFATSPNCGVDQQQLSVLDGDIALLRLFERLNLGSMNRGPLGMDSQTGKLASETSFPADDECHTADWHPAFKDGKPA